MYSTGYRKGKLRYNLMIVIILRLLALKFLRYGSWLRERALPNLGPRPKHAVTHVKIAQYSSTVC